MTPFRHPSTACRALLLAALAARPGDASAQTPPTLNTEAGTIAGAVLDGASGQPLAGAQVALEPAPAGALMGRGAFWTRGRTATTDAAGHYGFDDVTAGAYSLHVRFIGYRPTTIDVDLPPMGRLSLSVGLVLQPVVLNPLPVDAPATSLTRTGRGAASPLARADVERYRQEQYLTSDVRALTAADMLEAVTLGETDLLRAFQRLPGVTTRDDFTAQLWTRGARWSETRVYFDGLPLFNPVHAAGAFSSIPPDAVGAAFFHPGARSAAVGEGAAAALELSSRAAADTVWAGAAELSVVSARATVDRRFAGGRGGVMFAARRSHVDLVSRAVGALTDDSTAAIPYAFHDLATRVDVPVGKRGALQASALWEQDVIRGDLPGILKGNQGHWGNALGRLSLVAPLGDWYLRHYVGVSRLDTYLSLVVGDTTPPPDIPSHEPVDNTITYLVAGGEIAPSTSGGWRAGYEVVYQSLEYFGGPPTPYARTAAIGSLYRGTDSVGTRSGGFRLAGHLTQLALWGESRLTLVRGVTAQAGARVETGPAVRNGGAVRLAPRFMARYRPVDGRLSLTAGWGRSFQYTQTIAPTGPRIGPDLHVTDVWLLAGDSVPALRSDIATVGAEYWIADGWLGGVNLYDRRTTGATEPDPTPGYLLFPARPPFVVATNGARGIELSLRRLVGRLTASLAYSHVRSESRGGGFTYLAASERRHVFDGTVMVRVASRLALGGAVTAASGAPFTRFYARLYQQVPCDTLGPSCLVPGKVPESVEEPSAGRAPPYATIDLLAEWTWPHRGWDLSASLQLRNALNWRNASTYAGSIANCSLPAGPGTVIPRPGVCDRFDRGLPLLPLVGVRVAF
jgi:hypothetical protein